MFCLISGIGHVSSRHSRMFTETLDSVKWESLRLRNNSLVVWPVGLSFPLPVYMLSEIILSNRVWIPAFQQRIMPVTAPNAA